MKNRTIIWLHGLGASSEDLKPLAAYIKCTKEIKHIFLQAPHRSVTINNGYHMPAWYDIYSFDRENTREDESGILESYEHVKSVIDKEVKNGTDYKDIILAGFSQGAAVSLYTALHYTPTIGGAIILSGYLPLRAKFTKVHDNTAIPLFIAYGTQDNIVLPEFSLKAAEFLKSHNFNNITVKTYSMAHEICNKELSDINEWLNKI